MRDGSEAVLPRMRLAHCVAVIGQLRQRGRKLCPVLGTRIPIEALIEVRQERDSRIAIIHTDRSDDAVAYAVFIECRAAVPQRDDRSHFGECTL